MDDGTVKIQSGVNIKIKRTDGRIHSAIVAAVNMETRCVTVHWYEYGETKGKELEIDAILALNPELNAGPWHHTSHLQSMPNKLARVQKQKIRHDWYQTDAQVVITILLKNADKDLVKVQYGPRSLSISSPIPSSDSEYSLELELAHEIDTALSSYIVSPSKIEIKLRKKEGLRWAQLEGEAGGEKIKAIPQAVIDASGPQQPLNPFKKDWEKIEKEIKKMEEQEKPEGEEALNALFQKIYSGGSEEVRRAMNKSFVESGGTVLSTNWNQVGSEKVEVKPPDGAEFKKWDS